MKILVIDDNKADRDIITNHMKKIKNKEKIKIDECDCLKEGLNKITCFDYDIILLDLILPETDGVETVKSILEHLKNLNKEIPIVVLTGMEDYKIGREIWSLGIQDYLIKDEMHTKDLSRALTFAIYDKKEDKTLVT